MRFRNRTPRKATTFDRKIPGYENVTRHDVVAYQEAMNAPMHPPHVAETFSEWIAANGMGRGPRSLMTYGWLLFKRWANADR